MDLRHTLLARVTIEPKRFELLVRTPTYFSDAPRPMRVYENELKQCADQLRKLVGVVIVAQSSEGGALHVIGEFKHPTWRDRFCDELTELLDAWVAELKINGQDPGAKDPWEGLFGKQESP